MNKVFEFLNNKKYIIMGILGALLISMTLKTQVVVVTYGDEYSLRMEYTLYGYCIRASAAKKAAEPAVYNATYIGNSIDLSIEKAVAELKKIPDDGKERNVGIMVSGYPRSNAKLEQHLKEILEDSGNTVEILSASKKAENQ